MGKILLWIDEHINHPILHSRIWGDGNNELLYWIWEHTTRKFCVWAATYEDWDS